MITDWLLFFMVQRDTYYYH